MQGPIKKLWTMNRSISYGLWKKSAISSVRVVLFHVAIWYMPGIC